MNFIIEHLLPIQESSHPDVCMSHFLKQICTAIFFQSTNAAWTSLCETQNFKTAADLLWPFYHTLLKG